MLWQSVYAAHKDDEKTLQGDRKNKRLMETFLSLWPILDWGTE